MFFKSSFSIESLFINSKIAATKRHSVNPPSSKHNPDNNVPVNLPNALDI